MSSKVPAPAIDADVQRLAEALSKQGVASVRVAFVLGSGSSAFADRLERARIVECAAIDGLPQSSVPGHTGRIIVGDIGGQRVLVQQGRVHLYEGHTAHEVTRAVRAFVALGCKAVVLTNAAGGLRHEWAVGSLMRITDHINLQGETPLSERERGLGSPYDARLGAALTRGAEEAGVALLEGVYAGLRGPSYETPAEIRTLRWMGASAVGMSTVAEALAAHAAGAHVAAISCITNYAAGVSERPLAHDEVLDVGRQAAGRFGALLEHSLPHIAASIGA